MKKLISLALAVALCLSLYVPAHAFSTGTAGVTTTICTVEGKTMVLKSDGTLWMWGNDVKPYLTKYGSLDPGYKSKPVKIMSDVVSISCSHSANAAIKKDGTLWMWGISNEGQLGNDCKGDLVFNETTYQVEPVKIMDDVSAVSCGFEHTAVIKEDGKLYGWGNKLYLGIGKVTGEQLTPIKLLDSVAAPSGKSQITVPEPPSTWAKTEVDAAIAANLVSKELQKNYTKAISRGAVTQMIVKLLEQTSGMSIDEILVKNGKEINAGAFTDTSDSSVLAINALGIINGVGNGKFNPSGSLTRAQIAAIVNNIAKFYGIETEGYSHSFTDTAGHWADSQLGWISSVGIMNGTGENMFSPDKKLTTEQAIIITYHALNTLKAAE